MFLLLQKGNAKTEERIAFWGDKDYIVVLHQTAHLRFFNPKKKKKKLLIYTEGDFLRKWWQTGWFVARTIYIIRNPLLLILLLVQENVITRVTYICTIYYWTLFHFWKPNWFSLVIYCQFLIYHHKHLV